MARKACDGESDGSPPANVQTVSVDLTNFNSISNNTKSK